MISQIWNKAETDSGVPRDNQLVEVTAVRNDPTMFPCCNLDAVLNGEEGHIQHMGGKDGRQGLCERGLVERIIVRDIVKVERTDVIARIGGDGIGQFVGFSY